MYNMQSRKGKKAIFILKSTSHTTWNHQMDNKIASDVVLTRYIIFSRTSAVCIDLCAGRQTGGAVKYMLGGMVQVICEQFLLLVTGNI